MLAAIVPYHAPCRTECQRADADRGERAQEEVGGGVGQSEAGAEGHIRREAHRALRQEREKRAGDDQAGNLSDAAQPRAPLTRIVTSAWLPWTAAMRVYAFASFEWQPHCVLVS